jgi:demethoxyubiquinone hydroxylase (CLK1/Coq7/Cat5 family)
MEMTAGKYARATREGFADELMLIKAARQSKRLSETDVKRTLKNLALGAGAYGLGAGTSAALRRGVLPRLLPSLTPAQRLAIGTGAGLLSAGSSLALAQAMRRREELERE